MKGYCSYCNKYVDMVDCHGVKRIAERGSTLGAVKRMVYCCECGGDITKGEI